MLILSYRAIIESENELLLYQYINALKSFIENSESEETHLLHTLALLHYFSDDKFEAISYFEKSAELAVNWLDVNLGDLHFDLGKEKRAYDVSIKNAYSFYLSRKMIEQLVAISNAILIKGKLSDFHDDIRKDIKAFLDFLKVKIESGNNDVQLTENHDYILQRSIAFQEGSGKRTGIRKYNN